MIEKEVGMLKTHQPCEACGSSDAKTYYANGQTHCFSCNLHTFPANGASEVDKVTYLDRLSVPDLPKRKINSKTCAKFDYFLSKTHGNKVVQVANYYDPSTLAIVGQKVRYPDKTFMTIGKISNFFYGQHLFRGGRKLVITEGEIDCLTVSQVNDNEYPVVSLPCGAQSAKRVFQQNLSWLECFDEVILMFDMDEQGRKAVADVQQLLPNIKVATLPMKDANECLVNGRANDIKRAIWDAQPYKPDGIINGNELKERILNEDANTVAFNYPWNIPLNDMTKGLRKGEMVVLTAGTGVGKTTFIRQLMYDLGMTHDLKVGAMMLEENVTRTAKGLLSIHAKKPLHLGEKLTNKEYDRAFSEVFDKGNFVFYEHFGSLEKDNLLSKMRYLAVSEECDFIFLDHISIAVSGLDGGDERKLIDYLMTQLRSLVEETGVGMIIVSHLRRTDGGQTAHEEGGITSLSQLRGSHAISQLSDLVIGLERNQQEDDEVKRNTIRLRVLKNRYSGETGIGGRLVFNRKTSLLQEQAPEEEATKNESIAKELTFVDFNEPDELLKI